MIFEISIIIKDFIILFPSMSKALIITMTNRTNMFWLHLLTTCVLFTTVPNELNIHLFSFLFTVFPFLGDLQYLTVIVTGTHFEASKKRKIIRKCKKIPSPFFSHSMCFPPFDWEDALCGMQCGLWSVEQSSVNVDKWQAVPHWFYSPTTLKLHMMYNLACALLPPLPHHPFY